jgi:site-specific DNA recombinase
MDAKKCTNTARRIKPRSIYLGRAKTNSQRKYGVSNMMNEPNTNNTIPTVLCAIYTRSATFEARSDTHANQERICRAAAKQLPGWTVLDHQIYSEQASGLGTRAGLNSLLNAAKSSPRPFECVLVAGPDRLSPNLVGVAEILDELERHGICVYFAGLGQDSRHADFRQMLTVCNMINEKCVSALAMKVRRGQEARVLNGFTSGGWCFGYRSVRVETSSGEGEIGRAGAVGRRLEIIESEAETIHRIYEMFVDGLSVPAIAKNLNAEKVAAAKRFAIGNSNSAWNCSRIHRILRNERYIGTVVWNRTKRCTNPSTGRVEFRPKLLAEIRRVATPHLRIVSDELWNRVKARLARAGRAGGRKVS